MGDKKNVIKILDPCLKDTKVNNKTVCYFCSKDSHNSTCKTCNDKQSSIRDDIVEGVNFKYLLNKYTYDFILKFENYCLKENKPTVMPMEIDSCMD